MDDVALRLERAVAERVGATAAVSMASLREALDVVLHVLRVGAGSEVVTSPMIWPWAVEVIVGLGLLPRLAPVRDFDLNLDPELLARALPAHAPVVLVPHFAGSPAPLRQIQRLVSARRGLVIQDGSLALGARHADGWVGSSGTCIFAMHGEDPRVDRRSAVVVFEDGELADAARAERRKRDFGVGTEAARYALAGMLREDDLWRRRQEVGRIYDLEFAARPIDGLQVIGARHPELSSRLYYGILVPASRCEALAEGLLLQHPLVEIDVPELIRPRAPQALGLPTGARLIGLATHVAMQGRDVRWVVQSIRKLLTRTA